MVIWIGALLLPEVACVRILLLTDFYVIKVFVKMKTYMYLLTMLTYIALPHT